MGKLFGIFLVLALLTAGLGAGAWFYAQRLYLEAGPSTADGAPRIVVIEPKRSAPQIAKKLVEAGAIRDDLAFRIAVRVTNATSKLKAGEYAFASGLSLKSVVEQLRAHRVLLHPITVPEGLTSAMILTRLADDPVLAGSAPQVEPAEGVLLPDTYMVERGQKRADLVGRLIAAQQKAILDLWPKRQAGLPFETPEQAVILASIVEKETGLADERARVAAVFVNRLRRGMKLESDPTIIYGLSRGEPLGHGLTRSELDAPNRWNTYQIAGLPPTPICNPGRAAIGAVLNPAATDALYFVATGAGGHAFSSTYAEHLKNVAALRAFEKSADKQGAATSAGSGASAPRFEKVDAPPPTRERPPAPPPPKKPEAS